MCTEKIENATEQHTVLKPSASILSEQFALVSEDESTVLRKT